MGRGPTAPWVMSTAALAAELGTDLEAGLSTTEAQDRLRRDGANEITARPPTPWWVRAARQFRDPLVLLLLAAIAISLVAWWTDGGDGVPLEAIVIAAIVVLNAAIGYWQEAKALKAVAALARLSATHTSVLRDGRLTRIATTELVVGDVIALAEGDAVGADARIVACATLLVAEASLTGESVPVEKADDEIDEATPLAERANMVFNGTAVVRGRGDAVVTATAMDTELGRIASLLDQDDEGRTPLQRQVAWLGRRLGLAVVVLSAVVIAAVVATAEERTFATTVDALLVGVSLAVAAVPEGLPAILSVVLALGVQRMAREHAIVKRLASVETLGSATVICTDKTGTLTRNEMTIVRVVTAAGSVELTGVGYHPLGHVVVDDERVTDESLLDDVEMVLSAGSMANDATLREGEPGHWDALGDPTEIAFLVAEEKVGRAAQRRQRFRRVAEIPFSSERRRMTTVHLDTDGRDGHRYVLVTKGAPDVLLPQCTAEHLHGEIVPIDDERRRRIGDDVEQLATRALRTISVAYRTLTDVPAELGERHEADLVHLGVVGILDPPRPEVAASVAEARSAGIRVIMLTGDHPTTAARIGDALGIGAGASTAMTGAELTALDGPGLAVALRDRSVFARVEPEHKLRIVEHLQDAGGIVAMTGDGVNDAPALRRADIGVAMGTTGTEVSKEAADMILADDNFATILRAVREGREILSDIRKVLRYLLASNTGEVLVMLIGVLAAGALGLRVAGDAGAGDLGPAVPLLATQILWINLLTDGALALALGVDPAVDDVMQRPPRRVGDRVVDGRMLVTIALIGVTSAIAALVALDLRLPGGLLGGDGDIETARTMAFTTLVLGQVCNAFNARSDRVSAFVRPFDNRILWASIALTVVLQVAVVHLAPLQEAFDTAPLDVTEWAIVLGLSSTVLWVDELRKWIMRRHVAPGQPAASSSAITAAT